MKYFWDISFLSTYSVPWHISTKWHPATLSHTKPRIKFNLHQKKSSAQRKWRCPIHGLPTKLIHRSTRFTEQSFLVISTIEAFPRMI